MQISIMVQNTDVENLKEAMKPVAHYVSTYSSPYSLEKVAYFNTDLDEESIRNIIAPFKGLLLIISR